MLFLCAIVGVLCSLFLVTVEGTNGGMLSRVQDAPTCMPRPLAEQDADLPLNNQLWRGPTLSWNNYDQTTCYACLAPKERLPSVSVRSSALTCLERPSKRSTNFPEHLAGQGTVKRKLDCRLSWRRCAPIKLHGPAATLTSL
jgi:hypothetical protein